MIKLAISGCQGRMGQAITRLALLDHEFAVTTLLERQAPPKSHEAVSGLQVHTVSSALQGCDVLIEFTTPEATVDHLQRCLQHGIKMVIGTTGLNPDQIAQVKKAAEKIPVVFSSNMSVGVNILFKLTELAAAKTAKNYTVTMEEAHHIHKKDAPSGTAKTLAEIVDRASGVKVADIKSIREGETVGDHTVTFESAEDVITISHHAKNRDIFAKGPLVAAKFLAQKKNGLFSMQDVLGLS